MNQTSVTLNPDSDINHIVARVKHSRAIKNMSDDQTEAKESSAAIAANDTKSTPTEPKDDVVKSSPTSDGERGNDKPADDHARVEGPATESDGNKTTITVGSDKEEGKNDTDGDTSKVSSTKKSVSPADWPLYDIKEYHANDVLYGRGGGTNHHPGNKRYRKMVDQRKADYITSKRLDKPLVALEIIKEWRSQDPPGRFLKLDEKTGLWSDVGDKKAREKTSQALREKPPSAKKEHDKEKGETGEGGSDSDSKEASDGSPVRTEKQTRFDVPSKNLLTDAEKKIKANKRLVLRRDHSLGQDYIREDEAMTLNGFSWNDPVENIFGNGNLRSTSAGSNSGPRRVSDPGFAHRHKGWDAAFRGPRSESLPINMSPPSLRNSMPGDVDFSSMKPNDRGLGRRDHSLAQNPLAGGNVNVPARNPFADDKNSGDKGWGAPPPYGSRFPPPLANGKYPSDGSPPSRMPNNDGGVSAFSRPREGSAFMRKTSGGRGHPQIRSSSNSSITMEDSPDPRFMRGSSGQAQRSPQGKNYPDSRDLLLKRQSSSMSDDYRRVADMMGDDIAPLHHSWSAQSDDYSMVSHAPRVDNGGGGYSRGPRYSPENVPPAGDIYRQSAQYSPPTPTQSGDYDRADFGIGYTPTSPSQRREYNMDRRRIGGQGGDMYSDISSTGVPVSPSRKHSLQSIGKGARSNVKKPSLIRKLSGGSVPQEPPNPQERKRLTSLPKPNAIKRNTSNQNENPETKMKGIKRAVLSRDHSLASHALKQSMGMETLTPSSVFDDAQEEEMERLGTTFGKSKLNDTPRNSTTFSDSLQGMKKPGLHRTSTIEAVHEAFREGFVEKPDRIDRNTTIDRVADELLATEADPTSPINKPSPLSSNQRTNTIDDIARDMVSRERNGAQQSSIENLALVDDLENDPLMGPGAPTNDQAREGEPDVNQITDDWFERCDLMD